MTPGVRRWRDRVRDSAWILGTLGVLGFLVTWEVATQSGLVDDRYLPPATTVLRHAAEEVATGEFWSALGRTLTGVGIGLALAATAAVTLGLIIGASPFLRRATHSTIEFLRPIPSVALIPLAVLLYGTSLGSTLLLVCYAAFWQILIQVLYGAADVDPVADDTARSYRLSRLRRIRHVTWPTALPYIMTGLRLGATVALILAITAELVIGGAGLGNLIAVAQSSGAVGLMYALVLITGLLGVAINLVMRAAERRILSWHVSVRADGAA